MRSPISTVVPVDDQLNTFDAAAGGPVSLSCEGVGLTQGSWLANVFTTYVGV